MKYASSIKQSNLQQRVWKQIHQTQHKHQPHKQLPENSVLLNENHKYKRELNKQQEYIIQSKQKPAEHQDTHHCKLQVRMEGKNHNICYNIDYQKEAIKI